MDIRILVAAAALSLGAPSLSGATPFMSGSDFMRLAPAFDRGLQQNSSSSDQADGIQILAYAMGVHDLGQGILFCSRSRIDGTQLMAIARKYMADRPDRWADSASTLISESLSKAFPCPAGK